MDYKEVYTWSMSGIKAEQDARDRLESELHFFKSNWSPEDWNITYEVYKNHDLGTWTTYYRAEYNENELVS